MNVDLANMIAGVADQSKCIKLLKRAVCTATTAMISLETSADTALCSTYDATSITLPLTTVRAYKTAAKTILRRTVGLGPN